MTSYTSPDVKCCENQTLVRLADTMACIARSDREYVCRNCGFRILPMRSGDMANYLVSRLELKITGEEDANKKET